MAEKKPEKPTLYLANPSSPESMADLVRQLTGEELTPEELQEIEEAMRPEEPAKD